MVCSFVDGWFGMHFASFEEKKAQWTEPKDDKKVEEESVDVGAVDANCHSNQKALVPSQMNSCVFLLKVR